jgi:cytoskeletal protein CcmA (bactofilin family)
LREKKMIIYDKIEKDIDIEEDTTIHGMIVGNVQVLDGVTLHLHGMVIGQVLLKEKSNVYLHGTVNGDVINQGGMLEIFGVVNGKVVKESGKTIIDSNAIVRK